MWRNRPDRIKVKSFWANDPDRAFHCRCRAELALQPGAKHAPATGLHSNLFQASSRQLSSSRSYLVPDFQDEATSRDNGILEITTKTSPSAAENRCIGTAIATILPAKLSAAQNGAIHHPLSPPPSYPAGGPWQLTGPTRRQSSFFLQCSPSPCVLPGHSLDHTRVHEQP